MKELRRRMYEAEVQPVRGVGAFILWSLLTQATDPRLTTKEELEVLWAKFQLEAPDGVLEVATKDPPTHDRYRMMELERYKYEMDERIRREQEMVRRTEMAAKMAYPPIKSPRW